MRHSERELCDLLEDFDVNVCSRGAQDFIELCGILALSMGFASRGQCELGRDVRWLADRRGVTLARLYERMGSDVCDKLAEDADRLLDHGVGLPVKFTATQCARALAHWMAGC